MPPRRKIIPLEALRGLASVIVVFHHFTLGFLPELNGFLRGTHRDHALIGTPAYVLLNGQAMVVIFFVLSGHVLSLRGVAPLPLNSIAVAALKRWFRLVPVVLASALLSWLLFRLHLYHFEDAARLSASDWLAHFAYGGRPQDAQPTFFHALAVGTVRTFLWGDIDLNSNLWTMTYEFQGSFCVLAIAVFFSLGGRWVVALLAAALSVLFYSYPLYNTMIAFMIGLLGTALALERRRFGAATVVPLLIAGLYLCGYAAPQDQPDVHGAYAWVSRLPYEARFLVQDAGGAALLVVFASDNLVSRRFHGRVAAALGTISFPLYVLHTLIICSFSSWAYTAPGGGGLGVAAAGLTLCAILLPLVVGLTWLDVRWLAVLRGWQLPGRCVERLAGAFRVRPVQVGRSQP